MITNQDTPVPDPIDGQIERLTQLSTEDLLDGLGLGGARWGRGVLAGMCRPLARVFARRMAAFDHLVGEEGLRRGAVWALERLVGRLEVTGAERLPGQGPLLVLANHPGLSDTLALLASLRRPDLRIIAADWPFFRALPCTSRHLFYVPQRTDGRREVFRQVVGYLRQGGAVLAFPRGELEPDPAIEAGAVESLGRWSRSIGLLIRLVPEARVVPAVVSGVLSARAQRHPLTRLRRQPEGRKRLGEIIQIFATAYQSGTVRVVYGSPLPAAELLATSEDAAALTAAVVGRVRRLMVAPAACRTIEPRARARRLEAGGQVRATQVQP
jgi:1-acyl-sn-glycerol-3-phosphate acyltransferase